MDRLSHVVVFGECMVELVNQGKDTLTKGYAGDTYNTAVYLKRCTPGTSVSFLTSIGADFLSNELLFKMGEEEINTDLVYRSETRNLGLYMVQTDEHGERTFAYWRDNSAATQTMNLKGDTPLSADLFYFSGISLAILDEIQRCKLFALIKTIRETGGKVVFDPNYRPRLWQSRKEARIWTDLAYANADIAFPGGDDHLALYDHTDVDAIHAHVTALGVAEIVVKNGAAGVHIFTKGNHCIVPVERVARVVDTTAAGDAFNGGYLAARISGKSVTESAGYGAKVAATVISFPGAIVDKGAFSTRVNTASSVSP
ncbi:sugar kinase [Aestuariibacter sp. A3R04]|uniref:sugar kinase n=1 Tax=Aestuariibacter sp. A3R04 TaxID=2841571 RepID=UPI001C088403|nr:sugar kinase [Aestuariibacter sp. A3R04]MBU3023738.1 sugar kinase [Aestuariibacter sp. A3R04]